MTQRRGAMLLDELRKPLERVVGSATACVGRFECVCDPQVFSAVLQKRVV